MIAFGTQIELEIVMLTKSVLLLDFDNIFSRLWQTNTETAFEFAQNPAHWLKRIASALPSEEGRRWLVTRCYLNPVGYTIIPGDNPTRLYYSKFRPAFVRAGFEVIDCPPLTGEGKNAADIRIVIDALDLLMHRTKFDEFVIASGDADFTPLLQRLRAEDRRIAVVALGAVSTAYTAIADHVFGYADIESAIYEETDLPNLCQENPSLVANAENPSTENDVFAELVRKRYELTSGPINLGSLATEVTRACPGAKQSSWFGRRTFSAALVSLDLPSVGFSTQEMWNTEKYHPLPSVDIEGKPT